MADLLDATVLLTGATSGIGRAAARILARRARALVVQGPEAGGDVEDLVAELRSLVRPGSVVRYCQADYSRFADVVRLADDVAAAAGRPFDVVINNAAIPGPAVRTVTADENEVTLQVNYLAPVGLTSMLMDALGDGGRLRIVNVASATHLSATLNLDDPDLGHGYAAVDAYARSKLALVTYSCWLAAHLPGPGVEVVSMHPGVIATGLLHSMFSIGGDAPELAARAIVDVGGRSGDNGMYYDVTRPAGPNPVAQDPDFQRRLRELTVERLVRSGIEGPAL